MRRKRTWSSTLNALRALSASSVQSSRRGVDAGLPHDREAVLCGGAGGAVEVPELLPVRRHVGQRVRHRELEHDAALRMRGERVQEGHEVGDVVDDVVRDHDVGARRQRRDVRPLAEHRA